jgi:hypothetical protein
MVGAIAAAPRCSVCDLERKPTQSVPITDDYVVTSYERSNCKSTIRLAEWQDRE